MLAETMADKPPATDGDSGRRAIRIEIAPKTILWTLGALGAVWLFAQLWTVALVLLVALVVVGTLNPVVSALQRRGMRRGVALALIFVALLALTTLLFLLTVPPLISQLMDILAQAPAKRDELVEWMQHNKLTAPLARSVKEAGSPQFFSDAAGSLVGYSSYLLELLGYAFTTLFLAIYFLADGSRAAGALYAVVPRPYHLRLARILLNLETIVGGYMRGQLITSAAITVFTFALLTAFQVPNALSLAVFAGLTDIIPFIGGLIAVTPAVLASLSRGMPTAITILIVMIVYQEFETRVLVPRVYGRTLRLPPAAVILALLIGGTLLGILGALLALPIAAGLRMIAKELRVEMPGDATDDVDLRVRDEHAEQDYELRSAGAAPEEAGVIATELAKEIRAADAAATKGDDGEVAELPITGGIEDKGAP
jgi:putative heme transporter